MIHLGQSFRLHQPLPTCVVENDYQTPIAVDIQTRFVNCKKHKLGTVVITETDFYSLKLIRISARNIININKVTGKNLSENVSDSVKIHCTKWHLAFHF